MSNPSIEAPVSLFNEWLACNELGKEFEQRLHNAVFPVIRDACEANINLRELQSLADQVIGAEISTRVLMRTLQARKRERP